MIRKLLRRAQVKRHRHRSLFVAKMTASDQPDKLVVITNFAEGGFAARALDPPSAGERVLIEIAGLASFKGVVRWSSARDFGFRADSKLDVLELSTSLPGPGMKDYDVPHSSEFEGMYLQAAFQQDRTTKRKTAS